MSTHTPGPWIVYTGSDAPDHKANGWVLVVARNNAGPIVANVNGESCPDTQSAPCFRVMPAEANARLISAAPDLLALLIEADRRLQTLAVWDAATFDQQPHGTPRLSAFHEQILSAITKAGGAQ